MQMRFFLSGFVFPQRMIDQPYIFFLKKHGAFIFLGIRLTRDSWPDDRRDLKCRKARPQRPRLQMSEALMLQSVPPYVDTPNRCSSGISYERRISEPVRVGGARCSIWKGRPCHRRTIGTGSVKEGFEASNFSLSREV